MVETSTDVKRTAQSIPLAPEALVLGGGLSGMTVARSLSHFGIHVTIIEKMNNLGGKAYKPCSSSDASGLDGGGMNDMNSLNPGTWTITIITDAVLDRLDGHFGSFRATIKKSSGEKTHITTPIVVVATGYTAERTLMGLPDAEGICYLSDLAELLSKTSDQVLTWRGTPLATVTFLLDQTNDDIKIDSQIVLNQALLLREKFDCQVSVLCRDIKVSFDKGERLYRKAREAGVLFYKYDDPPQCTRINGRISLHLPDSTILDKDDRETITLISDLLVLPETFAPHKENESLCGMLGIRQGKYGYMMDDNPQFSRIRSNRRGILVVGACRFPQGMAETVAEANAAAEEIAAMLTSGAYVYGDVLAEVDPSKCALCYTCPRLCPHRAITIDKYAEKNVYQVSPDSPEVLRHAARVEPAACYGCGICIAECPAKAISLKGELPLPRLGANEIN